jgi:hypothetical protein
MYIESHVDKGFITFADIRKTIFFILNRDSVVTSINFGNEWFFWHFSSTRRTR